MYYLTRVSPSTNWPRTGRALGKFLRRSHGDRLPRHRQHVPVESGHRASSSTPAAAYGQPASPATSGWLDSRSPWRWAWSSSAASAPSPAPPPDWCRPWRLLYVGSAGAVSSPSMQSQVPAALLAIWHGAFNAGGHRRRRHRRHDHGLPSGGVFQRGRPRLVVDRARHGAHPRTGERGLRGAARAVHRYRGDLHHDGAGDHHDGLRSSSGRRRHQWHRAHHRLSPARLVVVADATRPSRRYCSPTPP
jgi:hypothetical protein